MRPDPGVKVGSESVFKNVGSGSVFGGCGSVFGKSPDPDSYPEKFGLGSVIGKSLIRIRIGIREESGLDPYRDSGIVGSGSVFGNSRICIQVKCDPDPYYLWS